MLISMLIFYGVIISTLYEWFALGCTASGGQISTEWGNVSPVHNVRVIN